MGRMVYKILMAPIIIVLSAVFGMIALVSGEIVELLEMVEGSKNDQN